MTDKEASWDSYLQISTAGRDEVLADQHHHPYEPTPYAVLERLAESGLLRKGNTLLDYGCGKGRVGLFLADRTGARTIGVEFDGRMYQAAMENRRTVRSGGEQAEFVLTRAESYALPPEVDRCYFFNPFSLEIFHKVLARILESYYEDPREILLFFYYPAPEYISRLMAVEELEFYDDIPCGDLFPGNDLREQILIFRLPGYGPGSDDQIPFTE